MPEVGLVHYLVVGALLFCTGLAVVMVRRNAIAVMCGLELILNAAGLNFVAFNRFSSAADRMDGQMFTIFMIILAAAEAAVILAILLNLYNRTSSVNVDEASTLRQ